MIDMKTVRDNLKNTIAGKETMLAEMLQKQYTLPQVEARALSVTMEFLEINIDELKRILQDVEQCQDRYQEGYEDGHDAGYEQAILKERG
jgi:flagellar biosynthesis/type III secretory pathway protein FliH